MVLRLKNRFLKPVLPDQSMAGTGRAITAKETMPDSAQDCTTSRTPTAYVAVQEGRDYLGIELQPEYESLIYDRIAEADIA